ncbi:hypothetical protein [Paraburkholderia sp.]|uniref:hypothetical protein n=1 Tax=Paraburkholderia sp. TaxID=1926495 RepID=UPI0025D27CCF|nr:hypothetical protein [Paraburkholderia sp.]
MDQIHLSGEAPTPAAHHEVYPQMHTLRGAQLSIHSLDLQPMAVAAVQHEFHGGRKHRGSIESQWRAVT